MPATVETISGVRVTFRQRADRKNGAWQFDCITTDGIRVRRNGGSTLVQARATATELLGDRTATQQVAGPTVASICRQYTWRAAETLRSTV